MPYADPELHDRLVRSLKASWWWKSGESFRASDMAQYTKASTEMCATVLARLVEKGEVCRRMTSGRYIYRKADTQLMRISWRHDDSIYDEIERERRGW